MKKILTILLVLFLSQVCFAGRLQEMQKAVIAAKNGAGCSASPTDQFTTIEDTRNSAFAHTAIRVSGGGFDACQVDVHIGRAAHDTSDFTIRLMADTASEPSTVLGTSSAVLNADVPVVGSNDWVSFTFSTSVTLPATYYIDIVKDDADSLNLSTGNHTTENIQGSADGVTYGTDVSTSRSAVFRVYGDSQ